ncbi:ABC transporter permease [Alteribacter natronophilus]|uniref:ABC transporter permease n=1 Tax=Alteribacter natronophilus TaxID=2583810 RepID=UPI001486FED3|nr:ABC transporter permease subunit [Alteribacter natronophilus]
MNKWLSRKGGGSLMVLPALFTAAITAGAVIYGIILSFRDSWNESWTLEAYANLFGHTFFLDSLVFSLYVTAVSTLISIVIGTVLARGMFVYLRGRSWKWLAWLPMLFPHFVAAYLILLFFSQSGWTASLLYQAGVIDTPGQFPVLTNDRYGIGLILTYVWKEVPFVMLMMLPVFYEMNHRLKDAAATLGGGRYRQFMDLEWHYLKPALLETSVIIFVFIIGAFEVPYLIGATYPKMLPVLSYEWFYGGDWSMRPAAFALMAIITASVLVCFYIISRTIRRQRQRMQEGGGGS